MSPAELEAVGLGQSRAQLYPLEQPAEPRVLDNREPTIIFLNFDGGTLTAGADDSRIDQTTISVLEGDYQNYGSGSKKDAVLQAVREDWAPYNVIITDRRPESGDYVMNMVGPTDEYPSSTLGIAPLDCGDGKTRNNITFAFHSADDDHSATTTATTISQEVAHSFGLEHVDDPSDIMNPRNASGDPSFRDTCIPLVGEVKCKEQHEAECGDESLQNSHQELYTIVGPAGPDGAGPSAEIVEPDSGDHFDLDEEILIEVEAEDGLVIREAALFVNGDLTDTDDAPPFGWTTKDVKEGEYSIHVEVLDDKGLLRITNTIEISVGSATSPKTDQGGLPGTFGRTRTEEESSCSVSPEERPVGMFAPLLLLLAAARRRRA